MREPDHVARQLRLALTTTRRGKRLAGGPGWAPVQLTETRREATADRRVRANCAPFRPLDDGCGKASRPSARGPGDGGPPPSKSRLMVAPADPPNRTGRVTARHRQLDSGDLIRTTPQKVGDDPDFAYGGLGQRSPHMCIIPNCERSPSAIQRGCRSRMSTFSARDVRAAVGPAASKS
jgi:hypothetical protein